MADKKKKKRRKLGYLDPDVIWYERLEEAEMPKYRKRDAEQFVAGRKRRRKRRRKKEEEED